MKKIFLLVMLFSVVGLFGCDLKTEASNSYVSVEINPGVEFVVDENGNVVAANGINDDGKTLIINVSFEGKSLDEALNIVLEEAKESGYLLSASYNSEYVSREISISVDSESIESANKFNDSIKSTVEKYIDENDLSATYKNVVAKGRKHLESIAKKYNPMITDEELAAMSYHDLLELVELATIEKAQMASIALEEYYLNFKETEFKFAYKEEFVKRLSELSPALAVAYNAVLSGIKTGIENLNKLEYDLYISEESQYLKFVNQLNQYKDEIIKLKAELANTENSEVTSDILTQINAKEQLINQVSQNIESVMSSVKVQIDNARNALNTLYAKLEDLEKQVSNIDLNDVFTQVENKINDTKNGVCNEFETRYASDIEKIKTSIETRKSSLESK